MKFLLALLPVLAAASAQYIVPSWGLHGINPLISPIAARTIVSSPIISPIAPIIKSTQYHAQDELGQFAFGHSSETQAREEVKSFDGTVRGAYSYVDPKGKLINVHYLADNNGFRVLGANNLPVAPEAILEPVKETPEVMMARAEFAKKYKEAKEMSEMIKPEMPMMIKPEMPMMIKPEMPMMMKAEMSMYEPVKETEEVMKARAEFAKKFKEVEEMSLRSRGKRDLLLTPSLLPTAPIHTPLLTKTTIKTSEFKPLEDMKTPAATRLADWKEEKKEIITPWVSPYVLQHPGLRYISW